MDQVEYDSIVYGKPIDENRRCCTSGQTCRTQGTCRRCSTAPPSTRKGEDRYEGAQSLNQLEEIISSSLPSKPYQTTLEPETWGLLSLNLLLLRLVMVNGTADA